MTSDLLKNIVLVGTGSCIGGIFRYLISVIMNGKGFPWGTLCVNVLGAFIAGFCYVVCRNKFAGYEEYFPVLFIGFLGAFTTFSTFALESTVFLAEAAYGKFLFNILLQNLSGISAAAGGFYLAKVLF